MDTKLKKSHKLTNLIIALIVLIPALVLVCLYPTMETAMLDKKEQWLSEWEQRKEEYLLESTEVSYAETVSEPTEELTEEVWVEDTFYLQDNFVNYAVEASYYQYAMLLQDATGEEVFTDVLENYGWVNDFYEMTENTQWYVEYVMHQRDENSGAELYTAGEWSNLSEEEMQSLLAGNSLETEREEELKASGFLGYLTIEYDSFGKLSNIRIRVDENVVYNDQVYQRAKSSIEQYRNNVEYYEGETGNVYEQEDIALEVCPKNFRAVYLIYDNNEQFIYSDMEGYYNEYDYAMDYYEYEPFYAPEELYFATGAYWIVLALAVFVLFAAMILPFFKKLETGWEKLFCMPTEIALCVAGAGIVLACGMCLLMSCTTMSHLNEYIITNNHPIELLGYSFTVEQCYYILLAVNFLGWAAAFFMEYICAAQLRQFFCGPMYYIKHRLLGVVFVRWIWKQCKRLYQYVTDIDISENMQKSIVKIVLANAVIVILLCCCWFVGAAGVILYSIALYILLKKYGNKLQKQYQSILNATGQMAEGDLHITLDEDLGIFEPLGRELEGVQQGFAKAVAEEAKSQNMKSELITNVSHDLKTPLTAIITYVDLLKNPDVTEEERKSYIETLDLKSQRLKVLIEDLFEVSKANSGNVKMNFMDVDIVKLMKEVRVEMSDKIE